VDLFSKFSVRSDSGLIFSAFFINSSYEIGFEGEVADVDVLDKPDDDFDKLDDDFDDRDVPFLARS